MENTYISKKIARQLIKDMLRVRMVEEVIAAEYPKQEMRCPVHLCIGHEAVAVGVCANLAKEDIVFSSHRSHGHYLAKGGSLRALIAELYGKASGCSRGRGGSQHLIDLSVQFLGAAPIVGGTIPVAVGTALATLLMNHESGIPTSLKLRGASMNHGKFKDFPISVVFFGDAAMEEGVVFESLNFASLKQLPVLFVCENNFYSILTHLTLRQPSRPLSDVARAQKIKTYQGDGSDVFGVYRFAKQAISAVRQGKGPVFMEFSCYRVLEHCGPNLDPDRARSLDESRFVKKKDPVTLALRRVKAEKILSRQEIEEIKRKIQTEIKDAFTYAHKSPWPEEVLERDAYAD